MSREGGKAEVALRAVVGTAANSAPRDAQRDPTCVAYEVEACSRCLEAKAPAHPR